MTYSQVTPHLIPFPTVWSINDYPLPGGQEERRDLLIKIQSLLKGSSKLLDEELSARSE